MSIEVNGVTLPDIPEDVLASYPYAVIRTNGADSDVICLWVSDNQMLSIPGELVYGDADNECILLQAVTKTYIWTDGLTEWVHESVLDYDDGSIWSLTDSGTAILWSNHDILEVTAVDETTGEFTYADEPYFASSLSDPNYYAPKSWFDGMAAQVRRLTGTSDKLTTDEMLDGLKSYEGGTSLADNERIYQVGTAASTLDMSGLLTSSAS